MDWKDRLIDILFEAKAALKPDVEGARNERWRKATKAANRAVNRAMGTELKPLRTATGASSPERKEAEREAAPVTPTRAEIVSGRRPSPDQPASLKRLRGRKENERQAFKKGVIDTENQRVIQRNSPDPAPAHKGRQAVLKDRLKAKFGTGKQTEKP